MLAYLEMLDTPAEKAKFEALYHTHRYTMLHVALGILKDHQLAEDAVQEAFLRLARNFSKIGEVDCPRTRMFAVVIVRNAALTLWSDRQRQAAEELPEEPIPAEYSVEEDIFDRLVYEEVLAAIQGLPFLYRDVLYLQCVEGYRLTEISKLLGMEVETVKKRAQRGRKKLLEKLREGDENGGAESGPAGGV